jgi:HK97 family phage portal protein
LVIDMLKKLREIVQKWLYRDAAGDVYFFETDTPKSPLADIIRNPIVRAALSRISNSAASVPLLVYNGEFELNEDDPNFGHLAKSVAVGLSNNDFTAIAATDLIVFGNSYWLIRKVGRRFLGLDYIHPSSINFSLDEKEAQIMTAEKVVTVPVDDLVHFKLPDPTDPRSQGLSLLYSIQNAVTLINECDRLLAEYLFHGAQPLTILITKSSLPEATKQRLIERIQSRHGRGQRFKWLLLEGSDYDTKTIDTSFKAGDLVEMRRILREEILACLNVPPAVVGIYEYANYANAREQTKIFWRETIIPLLRLIEETLNMQFFPKVNPQLWCAYDLSLVEALKENIAEVANSLGNLVDRGIITINEAREVLGFQDPLSWGNAWWGNINIVPIAQQKPQQKSATGDELIVVTKRIPRTYKEMWLKFLRLHDKYERHVREAIKDYAQDLRRRLKSDLNSYFRKDITDFLFNLDEEAEVLAKIMLPALEDILRDTPKAFGVEVDPLIYDAKVKARLMTFKRRIRWITETTWEQLRQKLGDALAEGGGWSDLIGAVEEVLGDLETWRAERIARTETTAALNLGYEESLKAVGVKRKMWVTAHDERVRETHQQMEGEVVDIDDYFVLPSGVRLRFPCDPEGQPDEVINCRCTIVPVD